MALCLRKSAAAVSTSRPSVARPRVACNATYKVTLETPSGKKTISCNDDQYILVSGVVVDLVAVCREFRCHPAVSLADMVLRHHVIAFATGFEPRRG